MDKFPVRETSVIFHQSTFLAPVKNLAKIHWQEGHCPFEYLNSLSILLSLHVYLSPWASRFTCLVTMALNFENLYFVCGDGTESGNLIFSPNAPFLMWMAQWEKPQELQGGVTETANWERNQCGARGNSNWGERSSRSSAITTGTMYIYHMQFLVSSSN